MAANMDILPPPDNIEEKYDGIKDLKREETRSSQTVGVTTVVDGSDSLQRRLGNRQIQLVAVGGSIGTGIFVSIGTGLHSGGPANLLMAFILYCIMVGMTNNCMAEMVTYHPVPGGFISLAGKYVDDAFGFMAGWNFFLYQAFCLPFEISALAIIISFWSEKVPVWAIVLACIVLYIVLNALVVSLYGEAEFWLSGGKVVLLFALFFFTFITMVGGNPQHDAYGFRYWQDPGPFAEYLSTGVMGRWEGFLACVWNASFCVVGPEFLSMVAAEAKRPRVYMKAAYKTVYARFGIFFLGSAICVGIVIAHNDPTLASILRGNDSGGGTAAASPYVIAMQNLGVTGFPHFVNALLCTSIFSAGNTYTFCATRSLYSLALAGRAPKIFTKCTKRGVPIYCLAVAMCFCCLGFLQVSTKTANALSTIIGLVTSAIIIDYVIMSATYVSWWRAVKAQAFDRSKLPYKGWFQPYCGYIGLVFFTCVTSAYGYASLRDWDIGGFFAAYTMVLLDICFFFLWKFWKGTRWVRPHEADLVWDAPAIDAYEASFITPPVTFWTEIAQLFGFRRTKGGNDQQAV